MNKPSNWENLGETKIKQIPSMCEEMINALLDVVSADVANEREPRLFDYSKYLKDSILSQESPAFEGEFSQHFTILNENSITSLNEGDLVGLFSYHCCQKEEEIYRPSAHTYHVIKYVGDKSYLYASYSSKTKENPVEKIKEKSFFDQGEDREIMGKILRVNEGIVTYNKNPINQDKYCKIENTHPLYSDLLQILELPEQITQN